MNATTRLQPLIIICAAVAGLILSAYVSDDAGTLTEPRLMILLFTVFVKTDMGEIGRSFRNVRFTSLSAAMNFIWTPIFAVILGMLFLGDSLALRIGLLMLLVTPCTDWYLVFTEMSKGNTALSASILPLNLVLQMVLLPLYLFLFLGTGSSVDAVPMVRSIVFVLVIPFIFANAVKLLLRGTEDTPEGTSAFMDRYGDGMQLVFLCLEVAAMFASKGNLILQDPSNPIRMLMPLGVFFAVNFIIADHAGKRMGFERGDVTSLIFTTLARNSPLALAIAVAAFPNDPLIALVLIVGPLIELPVLSAVSRIIMKTDSGN